MSAEEWYWCMNHQAAEPGASRCPPDKRLGPYPSRAAAEHWKEKVEQRNAAWDADEEDDW